MAEATISVDHDQFGCPVCLDLLKDPVTTSCGHSFCSLCINSCWDQEDVSGVYSCPQCRETLTPRPVLRRNNMLAEVVEKLKRTDAQTASSSPCYAEPEDVDCDFCTGKKHKAIKSCLVCMVSLCETHVKPHLELPALKKHTLVEVFSKLEEKLCSHHDKLMEIYCRTDQSCICYLCMLDKHKGHDTVSAEAERDKKQCEIKETQAKFQKKIQEKEKKVQELKQAINTIKISAQSTVDNTEKIFTELISSMEKKRLEVTAQIRDREKAELSQTEQILQQLEQEIADLRRKVTELEELSKTHDHIHFLQSFQSLSLSSGCKDSPIISVNQHPMFDRVRESVSCLKRQFEEFSKEKFIEISKNAAAVRITLPSEPKSREDFLQYFCELTLDPYTAHSNLILSEKNKVVVCSEGQQRYLDHPERFDSRFQVLCKERMCGHSYWEVEWSSKVYISVSYEGIGRKGGGYNCTFGCNCQSWSLECTSSSLSFWHNNIKTKLTIPSSPRIGVFVDHSAGILSFFSVSDTMELLHRVQTTFTQPLYAGLRLSMIGSTVRLCDPK
ncbi:tripartite motif-containing protein 16-like [Trichomycterus rosablanca]|uniref:tripartite motif-containing protein 16-like n=1 Tax=Trichomycterus rosablanca TaxID=2290929 RepID=UPI002F353724